MQRDTLFLLIGAAATVPLGLLVNFVWACIYAPNAKVYIKSKSGWQRASSRLTGFARYILGKGPVPEICICTDGSFIDSAVFFLAVVDSCPHLPNVRIDLRQVDWSSIPYVVARAENVISYYNRRLLSDITTPVKIWGNFCCYRGYALIGRKDKFSMPLPDLESANQALDLLSEAAPLKIITMGSDTISVLKTVLTPLLNSKRVLTESHPPDHALERFLGGRGDLFIGGLPQRLACARNGDTVEVITSDTNPLWFGIDAMIYKGDLVEEEVLLQIAVSWSRLCRKLAASESFCRDAYNRWKRLSPDLGLEKVCFTEEDFLLVMHKQPGKYIRFFSGRDDAATELITVSEKCFEQRSLGSARRATIIGVLRSLHEIYGGPS